MNRITGSCLCGAIHYQSDMPHPDRVTSEDGADDLYPAEAEVFAMVGVPADSFRVKGLAPSVFEYRALDGDIALRSFCSQCGTTLFAEYESDPKNVYVRTVTPANSWATDHQFGTAAASHLHRPQSGPRHSQASNVRQLRQLPVA